MARIILRYLHNRWIGWVLLLLLLAFGGTILAVSTSRAAVTLLYFSAISGDRQVKLVWQTATELNNAGFFVQRSSQRDSGYIRVNPDIIPAKGDGLIGATYDYTDGNLTNGVQYWYRLESIDLGQNSEFSEPAFVIVGATPTPTTAVTGTTTPSPTLTATQTPTATLAQSLTATPNQSGLPTATANIPLQAQAGTATVYPGPLQPGATLPVNLSDPGGMLTPPGGENFEATLPAANNQPTGPTATLIPFPTVTIIFPETESAPVPDFSEISGGSTSKENVWRLWPLGLLLVIWLGLAAWFYFSRHHLG